MKNKEGQEFTHFDKDWKDIVKKARDLGYDVYEYLPKRVLKLEKEEILIEISDGRHGFNTIRILYPFEWNETFDIRVYKLEFLEKSRERLNEILSSLESNNWFEKIKIRNEIVEKISRFKELKLEQLINFDINKLKDINQVLDLDILKEIPKGFLLCHKSKFIGSTKILTENKLYPIIWESPNKYSIKNDKGTTHNFNKNEDSKGDSYEKWFTLIKD